MTSASDNATPVFWHHHTGISVPDLDAAIDWYRHVLGFECLRRFPIPAIPAEVAELRNGPLQIELFQVPGANPLPADRREPNLDVRTHGTKHPCFATADVVALAEQIRSRGGDIVWVRTFPWGSNAFIRDCAGNLIEFVEDTPPGSTPAAL